MVLMHGKSCDQVAKEPPKQGALKRYADSQIPNTNNSNIHCIISLIYHFFSPTKRYTDFFVAKKMRHILSEWHQGCLHSISLAFWGIDETVHLSWVNCLEASMGKLQPLDGTECEVKRMDRSTEYSKEFAEIKSQSRISGSCQSCQSNMNRNDGFIHPWLHVIPKASATPTSGPLRPSYLFYSPIAQPGPTPRVFHDLRQEITWRP